MTRVYEVRVEGEFGEPMLRYLSWAHRVEPANSRIQLKAVTSSDLNQFLEACDRAGLTIEKVTKV